MDKNLQFKPAPVGNTANAQNALQLAYQALAAYYRVPEWMVSGTSGANFASSLTMESPLVRGAQTEQKVLKDGFGRVVTMALRIAEEQELLEPGSVDKLTLNIESTPLVVREPGSETARNKTLHDDGLLSKRTWSVREELDRDAELENIEEEREYERTHPPPAQPGQPGPAPVAPADPSAATQPDLARSSTASAAYSRMAPRPDEHVESPITDLTESAPFDLGDEVALREADLSHPVGAPYKSSTGKSWLVNKEVNGKIKAVKAADPSKQQATAEAPKKVVKNDAKSEAIKFVSATLKDSKKVDLSELAGHLKNLTVADLKALKAQAGFKGGATKQQLTDKLLDHIKSKVTPPEPKPAKAPAPSKIDKKAAAKDAVAAAFADPANHDPAALADHLKQLTVADLQAIAKQHGAYLGPAGAAKQKKIDKILSHLNHKKSQAGGSGDKSAGLPAPPSPGFTGTDANGHHWVNGEQVAQGDDAKAQAVAALKGQIGAYLEPFLSQWNKTDPNLHNSIKADLGLSPHASAIQVHDALMAAPDHAPPAEKIGKGDKAGVEKLVAQELEKSGQKATAVLKSGHFGTLISAIQSHTDGSVGHHEIEYALKNLKTQQADQLQPPAFAKGGASNKPNLDLPSESRPKLSLPEAVAVQKYTGSSFRDLNTQLREKGVVTGPLAQTSADLQTAFAKAKPFAKPVTAKRGLTLVGKGLDNFVAAAKHAQETGQIATMPGYLSTSVSSGGIAHFSGNVELTVRATHGLDLLPYTHYPHEKELLLNHGSKFRVKSVEKKGEKWHIELEQIVAQPASVSIDDKFAADTKTSNPLHAKPGGIASGQAPASTFVDKIDAEKAKHKSTWLKWLYGS